jgi:hypothetical protein
MLSVFTGPAMASVEDYLRNYYRLVSSTKWAAPRGFGSVEEFHHLAETGTAGR